MQELALWLLNCPAPVEFFSTLLLILMYLPYRLFYSSSPPTAQSRKSPPQFPVRFRDNPPPALNTGTSTPYSRPLPISEDLIEYKNALGSVLDGDPMATDEVLTRMLRAREGKVKDAVKMYERWLHFRAEYDIDNISPEDVQRLTETRVAYFYGKDKANRPACTLQPRYYHREDHTLTDVLKFAIHLVGKGVELADKCAGEGEEGQICILYDRRGMTRKNFDRRIFRLMRKMVDVVQICYAERLGKIYVIGTNWFFFMM
jgi:hypothetical protein